MPHQTQSFPEKLDVGCAFRKPKGYWGIDIKNYTGVDQVVDLAKFPWDLPDNSFSEVRVWHILQFLPDTQKTLEEIWRVAKPGAKVIVAVPYFMSALAFGDPGHIRFFSERTLRAFTEDSWYIAHQSDYTSARFSLIRQQLRTTGKLRKFIPFKSFLRYFLWNIYDELLVELKVEK